MSWSSASPGFVQSNGTPSYPGSGAGTASRGSLHRHADREGDELCPGLRYASSTTAGGLRSIRNYDIGDAIGEGTYGKVFKARDKTTGELVALKKMLRHHESEGFPKTETREIKILKSVRHPNMVCLREVVTSFGEDPALYGGSSASEARRAEGLPPADDANNNKDKENEVNINIGLNDRCGDVFMCFDYVEYDLAGLLCAGYK
jgi:serine/threonine protein kinase